MVRYARTTVGGVVMMVLAPPTASHAYTSPKISLLGPWHVTHIHLFYHPYNFRLPYLLLKISQLPQYSLLSLNLNTSHLPTNKKVVLLSTQINRVLYHLQLLPPRYCLE